MNYPFTMLKAMRAATVAATLSTVVLTSGCGNVLVDNQFSAMISDPAHRLPAQIEISIFDSSMGQSAEWAEQSMGTAGPGQPYITSFETSATKFAGDSAPQRQVAAGIYIPQFQAKGYFQLQFAPADGQTEQLTAPFTGYYDYSAGVDGPVKPLALTVTSNAIDLGWRLSVVAEIPPA